MRSKAKKDSSKVDELQKICQRNTLEDVTWLCSLSESEIDMLISLKMLVVQHAKMIGCEELAQKFDLKMLRVLALVHMENLKEKVRDRSLVSDLHVSATFMDSSNLVKVDDINILEEEEIRDCVGVNSRKRRRKPKDEDARNSSKAKC